MHVVHVNTYEIRICKYILYTYTAGMNGVYFQTNAMTYKLHGVHTIEADERETNRKLWDCSTKRYRCHCCPELIASLAGSQFCIRLVLRSTIDILLACSRSLVTEQFACCHRSAIRMKSDSLPWQQRILIASQSHKIMFHLNLFSLFFFFLFFSVLCVFEDGNPA